MNVTTASVQLRVAHNSVYLSARLKLRGTNSTSLECVDGHTFCLVSTPRGTEWPRPPQASFIALPHLPHLNFNNEDGAVVFFRNVSISLLDYAISQPRRLQSEQAPPSISQN
jgi:hypothetical protein